MQVTNKLVPEFRYFLEILLFMYLHYIQVQFLLLQLQMKRKTRSGASQGKWTVDNSSAMSDDGATVVSTVG